MISSYRMSIESKILARYGHTYLTDADIGKVIICVWHNIFVKGVLTKINAPFERGFYIRVRSNDGETHLILTGKTTGYTVVRVSDIHEKHMVRLLPKLPDELAKNVAVYR